MKTLLVVPRYVYNTSKIKKHYNYTLPIGIAYISAVLKKEGMDYECINLNHTNENIELSLNKKLDEKKFDVVCTGEMSLGFSMIEKIIRTCRKHTSKPQIIIGGAIITSDPELAVKNLDFDLGVVGEGERTIVETLKCLEKKGDLTKVDGLCWKDKEGRIKFTKPREVIKDIDSIPFPDYVGIGFAEYLDNVYSNQFFYGALDYPRTYTLFASRGCPYQCTFCYHTLGKKYRERSIENIMKEIEYAIKEFKINSLWIIDDLFAYRKERVYKFCECIQKLTKGKIKNFYWGCQLAVNLIDIDLLKTMKKAGCGLISFGFESYNQKVLESMKKPITPEQIRNAIKWCLELGITIEGGFIFGDSAETMETAEDTLKFWKEECLGQLGLNFIQPYPGSEIYERALKKGVIKDKMKFIRENIYRTNFFNMTDSMNDEEFKKLVKKVLKMRSRFGKYVIPKKIIKKGEDKYEIIARCPHCNQINRYKNAYLRNRFYFTNYPSCRECTKRFYIVSWVYKFTMDNYLALEFFRKIVLSVRKKRVEKKI